MLLLYLPIRAAFTELRRETAKVICSIDVIPRGDEVYVYEEKLTVKDLNGRAFRLYNDPFPFRYWPKEFVLKLLRCIGFDNQKDPFETICRNLRPLSCVEKS